MKEKFAYNKEIKKISKHRHLPKYLHNAKKKRQIMKESKFRKSKNVQLNNPDSNNNFLKKIVIIIDAKFANERKDKIMEVME